MAQLAEAFMNLRFSGQKSSASNFFEKELAIYSCLPGSSSFEPNGINFGQEFLKAKCMSCCPMDANCYNCSQIPKLLNDPENNHPETPLFHKGNGNGFEAWFVYVRSYTQENGQQERMG